MGLLVARWVKDLVLSLNGSGHFCGRGLIPGLGISICRGHSQKLKKKKEKKKEGIICAVLSGAAHLLLSHFINGDQPKE